MPRQEPVFSRVPSISFVLSMLCALCLGGASLAREPPVMVAVGDSITAGMANATLVEETQRLSYPALIAGQMRIPFGQPYINHAGLPDLRFRFDRTKNTLEMPFFAREQAGRIDPSNANNHNFAVPNARLWEILALEDKGKDPLGALFKVVLQGQGTQVEQARRQQPDLIIVWAGNNDVLHVVQRPFDDKDGKSIDRLDDRMTPAEDFRNCYRALIDKLSASYDRGPKKGKRPDIVVANIPDINDLPILVPLGCKVGQTCQLPFTIISDKLPGFPFAPRDGKKLLTKAKLEGMELCLTKTDGKKLHPDGSKVSLIACIDNELNGRQALFTALREGKRCFTDAQVLHPDQLARINKRIEDYNKAIKDICKERKIPVLDIHALFKDAGKKGIKVGKTKLTTSYTGGLFSLDAIHPSHTANAILANAFIEVINAEIKKRKSFGGRIKPNYVPIIKVEDVLKNDPQRPR